MDGGRGLDLDDAPSVLALVLNDDPTSAAWRIQSPIEALQLQGYPSCAWREVRPDDDALLFRLTQPGYRPDVVVFERRWFARWDAAITGWLTTLRRAGTVLITDTDDDTFDERTTAQVHTAHVESGGAVPDHPKRVERQRRARVAALRAVDGVTVTTPALAAVVRQHTRPGTPVVVVPNAIDAPRYLAARRAAAPRDAVTLGWVGAPRLRADLEVLALAWGRLALRYPDVRFETVGRAFGAFDGHVPADRLVDRGVVPPSQYPVALARLDVGCCPLAPTWFNRAKSPQKSWEHALTGAAVVCSPTVYGDDLAFVAHGGLIADGVDAWEAHLSRLIESAEERRCRADALAAWVLAERSLEANLWRWPAAWRAIVDQAKRHPAPGHAGGAAGAQRARQKAKRRRR